MKKSFVKKMRKCLALCLVIMLLATTTMTGSFPSAKAAGASVLPRNICIGYWHNFDNGSTKTKLRDVNQNWDVVIASFIETGGDYCTASFAPDGSIYGGGGDSEFISDVKILQQRGTKVMVSLGGQNGHIELGNDAQRDKFLRTTLETIKKYGFDGLDIDLEGSSIGVTAADSVAECASPIQKNLNYVLHEIVKEMGSGFMITMAPEHPYVQGGMSGWGTPWGGYLPLINNCRDILTFIHPQYYNNNVDYWLSDGGRITGYSAETLVALSEILIDGFLVQSGHGTEGPWKNGEPFEGLRPDQVAFGVPASPSAAGHGTLPLAEYQKALKTLVEKYPTFRGIMTWSTNWDEKENNSGFVNLMHETIVSLGGNVSPFTATVSSANGATEPTGTTLVWNAGSSGGTGVVTYKFTLYKDNAQIYATDFTSQARFSYKAEAAASYYVNVDAKDSSGNVSSKKSSSITVYEKQSDPINLTVSSESDTVFVNDEVIWNTSATGGTGEIQFKYELKKDGLVVDTKDFSTDRSYSYTPTLSGSYELRVTAKDTQANTAEKTTIVNVIPVGPVTFEITGISIDSSAKGNGLIRVSTNGGIGEISYIFYILKDGMICNISEFKQNNEFNYKLLKKGEYTAVVYAFDSAGMKSSQKKIFSVE